MKLDTIFNKRGYTKEQFLEAIKSNFSIRGVLSTLGLKPAGGNYRCAHRLIKELNIDISHFTGQLWSKGKTLQPRRDITEYLQNNKSTGSHKLKIRLIKERYLEHKCSNCNNTIWLDLPIPLELDHIDGNHNNNELSNLRLLCPNCHALTSTYRGKNKK